MTEAQAKIAISGRWVTAWAAAAPGAPLALGNEAATPPAGAGLFSALSFGPLQERQLTQGPAGSRRFEARGTVVVRLFGPVDKGVNQLAELAAAVRTALASQSIVVSGTEAVVLWSGAAVEAKQGGWWTNTVTVPFRFYDRR
jgi:hypothetical protein